MAKHVGRELKQTLARRDFLWRGAALGALASGWGWSSAAGESRLSPAEPAVRARRRLGRTGLQISDISFGSSRLRGEESVVRHALERGINYFDTAESYTGGASEETLGRALAGRREEVILASKVQCGARTRRDSLMRSLEESLRRLQTDRVEIYFNHAVNDVERLRNDEWGEFVVRAKEQGKIRFTGMSGHGGNLVAASTTPWRTISPTSSWSDTTSARIPPSTRSSLAASISSRASPGCPPHWRKPTSAASPSSP
ncbi:MAG: aldo/keto reductase [Proteobacteria bacterium]|nr:aldo/keto reductase [Pseudomonadota bacterium]